jgi:hypothetical protein
LPHTEVRFEVEGNAVRIIRKEKTPGGRGQRLLERMWAGDLGNERRGDHGPDPRVDLSSVEEVFGGTVDYQSQ